MTDVLNFIAASTMSLAVLGAIWAFVWYGMQFVTWLSLSPRPKFTWVEVFTYPK